MAAANTKAIKSARGAVTDLRQIPRISEGVASRLASGVKGINKAKLAGKALVIAGLVGGVYAVADALRLSNPHIREIAISTAKLRNEYSMIEEVSVFENLMELTGDPFSAAFAWNYWRSQL